MFLKVYHNLKVFRQKSQFSTWLYRIVVNTTYDFLRKRKHFVYEDGRLLEGGIDRAEFKDTLEAKEKISLVQKALGKVPIKYRTAVVLKDIEGISYIEISRILCCSIGTVESRIYRKREFLRGELLKFEEGLR